MFGHDDNKDEDKQADQNQTFSEPTATPPVPEPVPDDSLDSNSSNLPTSSSSSNEFIATPAPQSDSQDDQSATTVSSSDDDLLNIKQQALHQLSPLVSHLDQTPEEKFRTTMMMIQASDDQSMIKTAYESAKQITDDKIRAQALLDIVNEINYFTQAEQNNS